MKFIFLALLLISCGKQSDGGPKKKVYNYDKNKYCHEYKGVIYCVKPTTPSTNTTKYTDTPIIINNNNNNNNNNLIRRMTSYFKRPPLCTITNITNGVNVDCGPGNKVDVLTVNGKVQCQMFTKNNKKSIVCSNAWYKNLY